MPDYDLAVDYIDMTDRRRLWTRLEDARPGFVPVAGRYVLVGNDERRSGRCTNLAGRGQRESFRAHWKAEHAR